MKTVQVVMLQPDAGQKLDEFITEQEAAMISNPPEGDVVSCFMNLQEHHFSRMIKLAKNVGWTESVWCDYEAGDHSRYFFFWMALDADVLSLVINEYARQHNQDNPRLSINSPSLH